MHDSAYLLSGLGLHDEGEAVVSASQCSTDTDAGILSALSVVENLLSLAGPCHHNLTWRGGREGRGGRESEHFSSLR